MAEPTYVIVYAGTTSVNIRADNITTSVKKKVEYYVREEPSDENTDNDISVLTTGISAATSSRNEIIDGLTPGKTYAANVRLHLYNSTTYEYEPQSWLGSPALTFTTQELTALENPVVTSVAIDGLNGEVEFENPNDISVNYTVYLGGVGNGVYASGTLSSGGSKTLTLEFDDYDTEYLFEIVFSASNYEDGYYYTYLTSGEKPTLIAPSYSSLVISRKSN